VKVIRRRRTSSGCDSSTPIKSGDGHDRPVPPTAVTGQAARNIEIETQRRAVRSAVLQGFHCSAKKGSFGLAA